MEEENSCSSLPDVTVLLQPQQDSWTSIDHQHINGEQETDVSGDTEINQAEGTDQRETPEEAEQWEQIIWPMTCATASLSFATVQWDMPDPSAETPSLVTDSSLANEPDSAGLTSLVGTTSPSLHQSQDVSDELFTQEGRGEEDGFDSQLLNSDLELTGNGSEVRTTLYVRRYRVMLPLFRIVSICVFSVCLYSSSYSFLCH